MKFTKLHGCGNDYVYVHVFGDTLRDEPELARRISDRRFGVGADGLILLVEAQDADIGMRMYNADGSRAEMCGNGIRGLCKLAYENGLISKKTFEVATDAGVLLVELTTSGGKVDTVRVNMGVPSLNRGDLPMEGPQGTAIDVRVKAGADELVGTAVSMGNPHFVVFLDEGIDVDDVPVETVGPKVENHPLFPNRVNTEFVQVLGENEVRQRTWERGSGETLACGTGASAVAVAGIVTERLKSPVTVHLTGGDLLIEWEGKGQPVYMTGPAEEVFSGEYDWPEASD
ncbi:MAG: diaminopimelate epimerase [Planctomycetota bacterium]|jgi:diaminopimelate epimerase